MEPDTPRERRGVGIGSDGGTRILFRLAAKVLRKPGLIWPLVRAGWRFRGRGWYRRPPFLPLPPWGYVVWRMETAYGSGGVEPTPEELERYLRWTGRMKPGRGR